MGTRTRDNLLPKVRRVCRLRGMHELRWGVSFTKMAVIAQIKSPRLIQADGGGRAGYMRGPARQAGSAAAGLDAANVRCRHQRCSIYHGEAEASCLCLCRYRLRPQPLPWRDIPDPAIDAERRIIIGQEDCGPVWLYNGILNGWHPDQSMELLDRIKLRHWRRGLWPHWYFAQMRNLAISY